MDPLHLSTFVALLIITTTYGQTDISDSRDLSNSMETEPPSIVTTKATTTTTTPQPTTVAWAAETLNEGQAIHKALQYLLQHREHDWGWGNDTHHVMLTLQLANNTGKEIEQQSLEMQLSAKQMEIEVLLMVSKHHESPPPLGRLAAYTLALGALCKDPRSFHGRDLVASLLHREPPHDLEFAYATLAACSSAAHVRRRHIRRLLDIANAAADHSLDTISMVILALRCVVQDHRHRSLLHFVRRPMAGLARQQHPDGSFGSLTTTALAIQALEDSDSGPGAHQHWSLPAARKWLLERQTPDGGWEDVAKTAAAVAALTPASLAAVRPPHCSDKLLESRHDPIDNNGGDGALKMAYQSHTNNDSDARNVSFTYTLWLGTNVTENYTLYLTAPRNVSFYHVMQMAEEQEPKFKFEASEWPNGHYVHTLAGHKEEPMGYHYWLLYRLPEVPDPASPPGNQLVAPVGKDNEKQSKKKHILKLPTTNLFGIPSGQDPKNHPINSLNDAVLQLEGVPQSNPFVIIGPIKGKQRNSHSDQSVNNLKFKIDQLEKEKRIVESQLLEERTINLQLIKEWTVLTELLSQNNHTKREDEEKLHSQYRSFLNTTQPHQINADVNKLKANLKSLSKDSSTQATNPSVMPYDWQHTMKYFVTSVKPTYNSEENIPDDLLHTLNHSVKPMISSEEIISDDLPRTPRFVTSVKPLINYEGNKSEDLLHTQNHAITSDKSIFGFKDNISTDLLHQLNHSDKSNRPILKAKRKFNMKTSTSVSNVFVASVPIYNSTENMVIELKSQYKTTTPKPPRDVNSIKKKVNNIPKNKLPTNYYDQNYFAYD